MMKKKYILPIVGVTIAMLIFIALRISLAYLTDTESADNVITVGSVNLQISEGSFAQSSVIAEGQKLNKAPKIINTGKNDEYVFFKVAVPKGNVTLLYESDVTENNVVTHKEGTPVGNGQQSSTELFKMLANTPNVSDVSTDDNTKKIVFQYNNGDSTSETKRAGWILLDTKIQNDQTINGKVYDIYYFGYNKKLLAGSTGNDTVTLFDQIQLKSFIDQELSNSDAPVQVDVTAYGIQADELGLGTLPEYLAKSDLESIWGILERKQVSANAA